MRFMFFAALLLLSAAAPAFAQWQFQELPRRTCGECVLVKGYNPAKNSTRMWLKLMPIADVPDGKLYFSLSRNLTGSSDGGPSEVAYAALTFVAKATVKVDDTELLMVADGRPISLGKAPLSGTLADGANKVSTYFSTADWANVAKLGLAGKLEMRFGGMTFQLTGEHMAAIRDFIAYAESGDERADRPASLQGQEQPRRSCRQCVITKTYDPFAKTTMVLLKPMIVADVPGGKMYLSLSTTYGGETPFEKNISVGVALIAKSLVEAKDTALSAQVDGGAINFGRLAHNSPDSEGGLQTSSYTGLTDWAGVLKLGQGGKVEMRFDAFSFKLTDEHKAAILDFLYYGAGDTPSPPSPTLIPATRPVRTLARVRTLHELHAL